MPAVCHKISSLPGCSPERVEVSTVQSLHDITPRECLFLEIQPEASF